MEQFQNPVIYIDGKKHTNPDPFILKWCGKYYCYSTDVSGVNISVSDNLVSWEYKGYAISEKAYKDYWAPSVMYWDGIFYMYYSNIAKDEKDGHFQWLKVAKSDTPEGPFVYEKTFFDEFTIDSHPYLHNGQLYMFYSVNNWIGADDVITGTCIVVDKMQSPLELAGTPKLVINPSLEQEIYEKNRFRDGRDWYTLEGACVIEKHQKSYLMYSANAYESVDYFVGTAVAEWKNNVLKMKWKKFPDEYTWKPLLKKNSCVEGTGHNTVVKAPNLMDDWIVYHGRNATEELMRGTEQRMMRIDPLFFNGDEMLCFGPSYEQIEAPAKAAFSIKNIEICERLLFTDISEFYVAEYWLHGVKQHTGIRYGIYLSYCDTDNYVEAQFISGRNELEIIAVEKGLRYSLGKTSLWYNFNYTIPHKFTVQKCFDIYKIDIDDRIHLETFYPSRHKYRKIGIKPYFSRLFLSSMAMTESVHLVSESLKYLTSLYNIWPGCSLDKTIFSNTGSIVLVNIKQRANYREEFELKKMQSIVQISFYVGEEKLIECQIQHNISSFIHISNDANEIFIVDGNIDRMPKQDNKDKVIKIEIKGAKIVNYSYTNFEDKSKSFLTDGGEQNEI